ncbi:Apoptosis-inducing factor [Fragilaria crotonensis]|nr:Apoptosis-inducing factor [Fragilaria crotonensis]
MKLLVIGGGTGGLAAIVNLRKLDKDVEITVVEPKDFFEIVWASFRSPFEDWVADGSLYSLKDFFEKNNVTHIRDVVTKLDLKAATLKGGEVIGFDLCLVATGADSEWAPMGRGVPDHDGSLAGRRQVMKETGEKLVKAESVLVVGGGLIGSELAADIAYYSKLAGTPTRVTLVHCGEHLIPEFTKKPAAMVQKKLEGLGVKVILNDKAVLKDGKFVLLSTGEAIDAEEVIKTVGFMPINDFLKDSDLSTSLDEKGFIKVDTFLRVEGTSGKIFAVGDCCNYLPNAASQIFSAAPTLAKNLKVTLDALAEHRLLTAESKLKKVVPVSPAPYLATTGPKSGVVHVKGVFYTQYLLPWLKNSTMFFFKVKSELGFK